MFLTDRGERFGKHLLGEGGAGERQIEHVFGVAAEDFGDGAGGGPRAAGVVRWIAVEEFANLAESFGLEVVDAALNQRAGFIADGGC